MSQDFAPLDTDIAVVGMAGRFAGARDLGQYWDNLRNGVESIRRLSDEELLAAGVTPEQLADPAYVRAAAPLPDMEAFDGAFFGFTPREASIMDPQHRHFLECCWLALEDAAHMPEHFDGAIGVYAGSGHNAYLPYNLLSNPQLLQSVGFFLLRHTGNDKDFMTTRVSYLLNLKGPSVNVQTACSTSLVAIHTGCQALLNGECDMVLAGGVTIELPHGRGYVYEEGEILSPDGHCKAFDADSKGTVFGSGVGVVVLRRLADALADGDHIHAVIKGSAINNDGSGKVGYLAPSVDGQAQSIAEALAIANVPADSISYIETHGTGTPVGDPIEVAALTQAFRQHTDRIGFCGLGSVKSNIGHTDTAAGVASFIKVALALQHRELPPTLHFQRGNPACEFETSPFYVNAALKPWPGVPGQPRRAGVSSLGVGGTNAHVVLEQAPARVASAPPVRDYQLFTLSAKTASALEATGRALAAQLRREPETNLADVAYTLRVGRRAMAQRRVVVARDAADAAALLEAGADPLRTAAFEGRDGPRKVAFMFAGGGAQHPGMGADLYRTEPVFRRAVDECLALLREREDVDLAPLLFPAAGTEVDAAAQLERPSLALPALFTVQRAQALLWQSWGIEPAACIGHSMGEYTAAHLAGVFGLADALALVCLRGRLFETLPEGAMLSVPLGADELAPLLGPELSIAALNGVQLSVASGPVQAVEALAVVLAERDVEATRVRIKVAAHSSMLEPILEEFHAFLRRVPMQAPTLPVVSNLSGRWMTAAEATDPSYWVRHLRETVRFADGVQELLADEGYLLLEVGPGRTLASLARMHPARKPVQATINGMRHPEEKVSDQAFMLLTLGRLAGLGMEVDWVRVEGDAKRSRLSLPGYAFERQRHWIEPGQAPVLAATPEESLARQPDVARWFYQPAWRETSLPEAPQSTGEVVLLLADEGGLAARLAAHGRELGAVVVLVHDGDHFALNGDGSYTIDLADTQHHQRLLSALVSSGRAPRRIVHAAALPVGDRTQTDERLRWHERKGFLSLLRLAQAIGAEDLAGPIGLTLLTERAQRVAGDAALDPAAALAVGACKVIPQELPQTTCRIVDIDQPASGTRLERRLVESLWAELLGAGQGDGQAEMVAWRGGTRWLQEFLPTNLPAGPRPLRERGVVLITGGLGGVGLALAEAFARASRARLVLVGRTALPARDAWEAMLKDPATPRATAARLRAIRRMEAAGAEVLAIAADVADAAAMRRVVEQTQARFGELHGVLHAAGVLDDGPIQLKDEDAVRAVLAPKVEGILTLDAALRRAGPALQPEFVVLFSSISAFAGLAGQFDYAAANAYLDAFAQQRAALDGPYTVAVDWSQWQEVGMAAALARRLGVGGDALDDDEGASAVDHPLLQHRWQPAVEGESVFATRFAIDTHWLLDEHRVRDGEALIPGTGYLELLRAATAAEAGADAGKVFELRDLTFLAPFVVHANEARDLRVRLRRRGDEGWDVEVLGAAADEAGERAWLEHAHGRVAYVAGGAPEGAPLAGLRARCRRSRRSFRGDEQPEHLNFGPRWGGARRIDVGDGEALVSVELPTAFESDLAHIALHPSLMDWATAGAQTLIPGHDESSEFYVPASYGLLRQYAPLTRCVLSHVRLREEDTLPGEVAAFDVTVMDEGGRVLVAIERFTMLRLRDKALFADASAVPTAHHTKPRVGNAQLVAGLREGIATDEGVDALMRVLAQSQLAQVVVSPQPLRALLAAMRRPARAASAAAAPALAADARAPRTDTEMLIATLWGELLGIPAVSRDDNFFDLGGHSLLAVQVINKLKKKTGRPLSLTALMEAPTVESLAALIDPEGSAAIDTPPLPVVDTVTAGPPTVPVAATELAVPLSALAPREAGQVNRGLVTIRKGTGQRPPLFFVHDGLGETLLYRTLAHQLDAGATVYGLQPAQRADGSYIHTHIRDMAAAHLRQVRAAQAHGPYHLAGLCAGGVIAMEMAWQLQQAGEPVAFVGVLDAADVKAAEKPWRGVTTRWQRVTGAIDAAGGVAKAGPVLLGKAINFLRYQFSSRIDRQRHARDVERLRERGNGAVPEAGQSMAFLPMYEVAHRQHEPQGCLRGGVQVALYKATRGDGSSADEAYVDIYRDPLLGWQPRVEGPIDCKDVPGGHTTLLQEPNVQLLAVEIQQHLDGVWAREAAAPAPEAGPLRRPVPLVPTA
jgi:acyl transferase domain-containing protein/thioesterase domain-containing protein